MKQDFLQIESIINNHLAFIFFEEIKNKYENFSNSENVFFFNSTINGKFKIFMQKMKFSVFRKISDHSALREGNFLYEY